jgi:hypothetical protein
MVVVWTIFMIVSSIMAIMGWYVTIALRASDRAFWAALWTVNVVIFAGLFATS